MLSIPDWMILYHMAQCMHEGHVIKLIDKMVEEDGGEVGNKEKDNTDGRLLS